MRILFYGNHLKHYYLAKWLRKRGHECDLYLLDRNKPSSLPEWDNPALVGNYPGWVFEFYQHENTQKRKLIRKVSNFRLMPIFLIERINKQDFYPPKEIKRISQAYDLVFTSGGRNILQALNFDIPVVFRVIGSDMARLPFSCGGLYQEALSYAFRRRIKKVKCIIAYQQDTIWSARFLRVYDKLKYFSVPTDVDEIDANMDKELLKKLNAKYHSYDYVFFLPARKVMNPNNSAYKGPEKFLRAFKRLIQEENNIKVISIMEGSDASNFERLIKEMHLEKYFDYLRAALPLYELSAYMKMKNGIVFNDFGFAKTHLTGISREALSTGAILVDNVDIQHSHFKKLYGVNSSILQANEEVAIYNQMLQIVSMSPKELSLLREKSLSWAYKNLHWENRIDELVEILKMSIK